MNARAPSSGRAASRMRAAAIGLSAVAAAVALAGARAARATAALRHERVPFQLIQRFPLNPRPEPAASPKPAAPAPVAIPLRRDSGAGIGLPLAWLLLAVACACLVVGVWIARRRASPARAPRHPRREGQASARSTSQRGWGRRRSDRFIPSQESRGNGVESAALERHAHPGVAAEAQKDMAGTEAANRRAAEPGHADGAFRLGVLLEQQGELDDAIAAYRRADQRGDAAAAFRLGVLLEERGELADARAAYGRASQRGDGEPAIMARAALLNLTGGFQHAKAAQTAEPQTGGQVSTPQRAVRASRTAPGATKSRVLAALADGQARTAGEVASTIGLARGTVSATLSRLAHTGEVIKAERGYRLPASSETDGPGTVASEPERRPT
jgi:DNA-binding transcriptional ArsR family regulator